MPTAISAWRETVRIPFFRFPRMPVSGKAWKEIHKTFEFVVPLTGNRGMQGRQAVILDQR